MEIRFFSLVGLDVRFGKGSQAISYQDFLQDWWLKDLALYLFLFRTHG